MAAGSCFTAAPVLFLFGCLCLVFPLVPAQTCPPLTTSIARELLMQRFEVGSYTANFFRPLCYSYGDQIDEILFTTLAVNYDANEDGMIMTNITGLIVARCDGNNAWMSSSARIASPAVFDLPLMENCSNCGEDNSMPTCTGI